MYRSIFIDLDDTVWAFTENARDTFQDMYDKYHFDRYFRSFSHFYTLYSGKNEELWNEYGAGRITKDELNEQRFAYPLLQVGVADKALVKAYSDNFFDDIVYKKKLMPHAREALEYLASAYNLYILSNGFRELQEQKMRSAGVEGYFRFSSVRLNRLRNKLLANYLKSGGNELATVRISAFCVAMLSNNSFICKYSIFFRKYELSAAVL